MSSPERERGAEKSSGAETQKSVSELKAIASQQKPEVSQNKPQADTEKSIEKAREVLKEKTVEQPKPHEEQQPEAKSEKPAEKPHEQTVEHKPVRSVGKRERQQAYQATMKVVRDELTPAQRTFSKLIHARPIEVASELLEETIFRPSFLWGGLTAAFLFGGTIYIVARIVGFELSGSELTLSLLVGGVVGFIFEQLLRVIRKKR